MGLQGHDEDYLKAAACAKHFAVHSGPESVRHEFNAEVSEQDLRETYLPAFKACVQEGKVEAVMGALQPDKWGTMLWKQLSVTGYSAKRMGL